jgi:hypothetical protein
LAVNTFFFTFSKKDMPQSRKRHGHHEYRKPSSISPKQKAKGRITWAILLGVFGLLVGYFAASENYTAVVVGALIGAALGYIIGKSMEQQASH